MALQHTLFGLKEKGLITWFDWVTGNKATITLLNKRKLIIYMADEYIVGVTDIRECFSGEPIPDYILYNAWDKVTDEAFREAKRQKVPMVSYSRFCYILEDINAS